MKLRNTLTLCLLTSLILLSCKKPEDRRCFKSNGSYSEQTRLLSEFSTLELNEHLSYLLVPDTSNYIVLKGNKNLLNWIETQLDGSTLTIENLNKCRFLRSYEDPVLVEIHFTQLNFLNGDISHDLNCKDSIVSDFLNVELYNGSSQVSLLVKSEFMNVISKDNHGDIILSGLVDFTHLQCHFNAKIDASNLIVGQKLEVTTSSNREVIAFVDEKEFVVNLNGEGNVLYSGNPSSLTLNQSGSGNLVKID